MSTEGGRSGFEYQLSPIEKGPRLQLVQKVHALHEPVTKSDGTIRHWWDLAEDVQPYATGLELSDNIRDAVYEYITHNLPRFREGTKSKFPSPPDKGKKQDKKITTFSDKEMLEAIIHNWSDPFEGESDEPDGHGHEVLISVASHVVNRIETKTYQEMLRRASTDGLTKLGLTSSQRDLTVDLLEIMPKADPLFTRFLSFAQLTPDALTYTNDEIKEAADKGITLKRATPTTMFLPQTSADKSNKKDKESKRLSKHYPEQRKFGDTPYTFPTLFPKESSYIARHLQEIVDRPAAWQQEPQGELFREYLQNLALLFQEKEGEKMKQQQEKVDDLYETLFKTDFPIIVIHPTEGYYKEPYIDPELRIALTTPDTKPEIAAYEKTKHAMADSLETIGLSEFATKLHNEPVKSAISFGAYGVNTTFNAVAQENPTTLLFLNDQLRAYDRDFYKFMKKITNTENQFGTTKLKGDPHVEFMCRMTTILHEFSHVPYRFETVEEKKLDAQKRIGDGDEATEIDEIKADILYRSLIPTIIEKGGLEGTKEQWAIALVASALQSLESENDDSAYALNAIYTLNGAFKEGIIVQQGKNFHITDYDELYATWKKSAEELISIYEGVETKPKTVSRWIKERCQPNKKLRKAIKSLQEDKEDEE